MRRIVAIGPAFVVLAVMAAVTFLGPGIVQQMVHSRTQAEVVLARQVLQDDDILERIDRATRRIADSVRPSLVHIEVTLRAGDGEPVFGPGASGSGWVYDTDGHIVTNAHVIGAAESAQVEFSNGRTATARLVEAGGGRALRERLAAAQAERDVVWAITSRQQTIKKLWRDATPGYKAVAAQLADMENQLRTALM